MSACKLHNGRQFGYDSIKYHAIALRLKSAIGTARVNAEMCMLSDESQRSSVVAYTISVYAVALSLVALRVVGKIVSKRLAWNDAPIVAAALLAAVPIACVLASKDLMSCPKDDYTNAATPVTKIGFGEHLWNLDDDTFVPILRYCESMPQIDHAHGTLLTQAQSMLHGQHTSLSWV